MRVSYFQLPIPRLETAIAGRNQTLNCGACGTFSLHAWVYISSNEHKFDVADLQRLGEVALGAEGGGGWRARLFPIELSPASFWPWSDALTYTSSSR